MNTSTLPFHACFIVGNDEFTYQRSPMMKPEQMMPRVKAELIHKVTLMAVWVMAMDL